MTTELDLLLETSEDKWNPECVAVPIRWIEAVVMLRWHKTRDFETPPSALRPLNKRLQYAFDKMRHKAPDGVFAKISTCSPKDVETPEKVDGISVPPVFDATAALELLCRSPRVMRDLEADINSPGTHFSGPNSLLRAKILIKPWTMHDTRREIRCFVVEGRFRGLMQYDYISGPWDVESLPPDRVLSVAARELNANPPERSLPRLDSFAADFLVDRVQEEPVLKLVEYNPIQLADDFLFSCTSPDGVTRWPAEPEFRHATATTLSSQSDLLSLEVECVSHNATRRFTYTAGELYSE